MKRKSIPFTIFEISLDPKIQEKLKEAQEEFYPRRDNGNLTPAIIKKESKILKEIIKQIIPVLKFLDVLRDLDNSSRIFLNYILRSYHGASKEYFIKGNKEDFLNLLNNSKVISQET
ncbi:hypothetical protein LCGC14_0839100 [marine sediment metagenome]|uniref:Uncharacterized protein n=1 Tax=marine sediment metagenome TaxID=412755 RepID=A0A0F9SL07_9ZZZZ|nr:hypothetical protein [bacterium]